MGWLISKVQYLDCFSNERQYTDTDVFLLLITRVNISHICFNNE